MFSMRLVPALVGVAFSASCGGQIANVLTDDGLDAGVAGSSASSSGSSSPSSSSSGSPGTSSGNRAPSGCEDNGWDLATLPDGMTLSGDRLRVERNFGYAGEGAIGTVTHDAGKYYFEAEFSGPGDLSSRVGITGTGENNTVRCDLAINGSTYCYVSLAGGWTRSGGGDESPGVVAAGDVVGVAVDLDKLTVTFTVNGKYVEKYTLDYPNERRIPMRPIARPWAGDGFRAGFSTFRYGPPAGYAPWSCTP